MVRVVGTGPPLKEAVMLRLRLELAPLTFRAPAPMQPRRVFTFSNRSLSPPQRRCPLFVTGGGLPFKGLRLNSGRQTKAYRGPIPQSS